MNINMDTTLLIKGKKYTMEAFMNKFALTDEDRALTYANMLIKKGIATVYSSTSDEEELIAKLDNDIAFQNMMNQLDSEEYASVQARREEAKEDVDLVSIALNFKTSAEACTAENWINSIGIEDTEISMKKGAIKLLVKNITPQEYTKIATRYQLEKAINTTVDVAGKTLVGTTDAINYVATKVVAPTAKIAGEAGMNLGKGLFHTSVKVGAGLVNATSKAVADTKVAMATDTELLKAKRELTDAKDNAISFFRRKLGSAKKRSGIETL